MSTCDEGVGAAAVVPHQGEEDLPGHKGAEEQRFHHLETQEQVRAESKGRVQRPAGALTQ